MHTHLLITSGPFYQNKKVRERLDGVLQSGRLLGTAFNGSLVDFLGSLDVLVKLDLELPEKPKAFLYLHLLLLGRFARLDGAPLKGKLKTFGSIYQIG